jgi:hypothetical protein
MISQIESWARSLRPESKTKRPLRCREGPQSLRIRPRLQKGLRLREPERPVLVVLEAVAPSREGVGGARLGSGRMRVHGWVQAEGRMRAVGRDGETPQGVWLTSSESSTNAHLVGALPMRGAGRAVVGVHASEGADQVT